MGRAHFAVADDTHLVDHAFFRDDIDQVDLGAGLAHFGIDRVKEFALIQAFNVPGRYCGIIHGAGLRLNARARGGFADVLQPFNAHFPYGGCRVFLRSRRKRSPCQCHRKCQNIPAFSVIFFHESKPSAVGAPTVNISLSPMSEGCTVMVVSAIISLFNKISAKGSSTYC